MYIIFCTYQSHAICGITSVVASDDVDGVSVVVVVDVVDDVIASKGQYAAGTHTYLSNISSGTNSQHTLSPVQSSSKSNVGQTILHTLSVPDVVDIYG